MTISRALYRDEDGTWQEKDTKTEQTRRVVLDEDTVDVLRERYERARSLAPAVGIDLASDAYVFSAAPDGCVPLNLDTVSQRYERMTTRLGIKTNLKNLRHYSATELILAGVDARTVGGRLGHAGGGATTFRVYAAWTSEADQRARLRH